MSPETAQARAILASRGYESNITDLVHLTTIPSYSNEGGSRALFCIRYDAEVMGRTRQILVAEINAPALANIFELLEDSDRAGTFFQRALKAIPEHQRPAPLPPEVENAVPDLALLNDMKRAAQLADRSARSGVNSVAITKKTGQKIKALPF